MLNAVRSVIRRILRWFIDDLAADYRVGGRMLRRYGPRCIAFGVEKWLGFWSALLLTVLLGQAGIMLIEAAGWASGSPSIAASISGNLPKVVLFGILIVLSMGLVLFSIFVVTTVRGLLWLRTAFVAIWRRYTPPYVAMDTALETTFQPPDDDLRSRSWKKAVGHYFAGSTVLMLTTSLLLLLEQHAGEQLYGALSNPHLSVVGDVIDTAFFGVDVEGLLLVLAPGTTQTKILLSILIFGIPAIWFLLSARNLLFLLETGVRLRIIEIRESRGRTWATLSVGGMTVYFLIATLLGIYRAVYGI